MPDRDQGADSAIPPPPALQDAARSRHLLLVAYYFPPAGGVLVRRVLRFLRHLPAHGWRCSVLTADRPYDPFHPEDPSGLENLPPVVRVLRPPARSGLERALATAFERARHSRGLDRKAGSGTAAGPEGGRLRRLLHETIACPDPKRAWVAGAVSAAVAAAQEDPFDLVLATGYPWSAFVAADRLRARLGVPMVLDFRDAWTLNPRELWTGPRCRRLEKDLVTRAAAVTLATDWIRDRMRERYAALSPERFATITNGFDLVEAPAPDPSLRDPKRLVLTYTGTFNDALPPSRYDNTPYFLLRAIEGLDPERRSRLRVRLVGRVGPAYRHHIETSGLGDVVEIVGPVSHARALQQQQAADVLFLVIGDAPTAPAILTGKLVEYAGARRPVLALVPDCEAGRAVLRYDLGWVEPPEDVPRIAARLAALVDAWCAGTLRRETALAAELSAQWQVRTLAEVMARAQPAASRA